MLVTKQIEIGYSFQFRIVVHTAGAFAKADLGAHEDVDIGSASNRVTMKRLAAAPLVDLESPT